MIRIASLPFAVPRGQLDFAVAGKETGVFIEQAGIEKMAVVDEQLLDGEDIFHPPQAVLQSTIFHKCYFS